MALFNMVKDNTDSLCSSSCDTPPLHPLLAAIFKMVIGHREGKGKGEGGTTSGCEKVSPSALPTHETTQRLPEEGEGKPGGRLPLQLHHNDDGAPHLARNLWQGCWSRSSCG